MNEAFEIYLAKYMNAHNKTREEALQHVQVQAQKKWYEENGEKADPQIIEKARIGNC